MYWKIVNICNNSSFLNNCKVSIVIYLDFYQVFELNKDGMYSNSLDLRPVVEVVSFGVFYYKFSYKISFLRIVLIFLAD